MRAPGAALSALSTQRIWIAPKAASIPSVSSAPASITVSNMWARLAIDPAIATPLNPRLSSPNDEAHPRRPLVRQNTPKNPDAAGVCCSNLFGAISRSSFHLLEHEHQFLEFFWDRR